MMFETRRCSAVVLGRHDAGDGASGFSAAQWPVRGR